MFQISSRALLKRNYSIPVLPIRSLPVRFYNATTRPLSQLLAQVKLKNEDKEEPSTVSMRLQLPMNRSSSDRPEWKTIEISGRIGQTLLDVAHANNLNVNGTCDGDLNCSTCHCVLGTKYIFKEVSKISPMTKQEEDLLDAAWDVGSTSRLSCQVPLMYDMEGMTIRFPNMIEGQWHQNHVQPKSLFPTSRSIKALGASKVGEIDYQLQGKGQHMPSAGIQLSMQEVRSRITPKKFKNITKSSIRSIFEKYAPENAWLRENLERFESLAEVLPFRTNNYVVEDLIDWKNVPNDPIFRLNFPQPNMLNGSSETINEALNRITELKQQGVKGKRIRTVADEIRAHLNPHPAKQKSMNVPVKNKQPVQQDDMDYGSKTDPGTGGTLDYEKGVQHKYRETVLFFPSEAQYCHSYCTYCFRWAQFVGSEGLQFASNDLEELLTYLRANKHVTDVLFTGGDPMVMSSKQIRRYLMAIVEDPTLRHVQTIRIGSKSLAYWPHKYVTEKDSSAVLQTFRDVVNGGKHLSFMAHFTHPAELKTEVVKEAIRAIRKTGTVIRAQAPLVQNINDSAEVWAQMWKEEVELGIIPYYMFVERDTGAKDYFGLPLHRCLEIYNSATQRVSGLARTARGPSMSCTPGKVAVQGIETIGDQKVFVLKFLQARNPEWQSRVFFAQFDPNAKWMDDLKPAFGEKKFFFEDELERMEQQAMTGEGSSGQLFN